MKLLESVEAAPSTTADGNIFVYLQNTWEMTGALGGSLVSNPSLVIHPNGLFTFTETAAFSGTVDGKSGTLAWRSSGTGDGVNFVGRFSILLSTGELASLRGQGTFELHPEGEALVGTYSVSYLLGP